MRQADPSSRQHIESREAAVAAQWREVNGGLEKRKEVLAYLAQRWSALDALRQKLAAPIAALNARIRHLDPAPRSLAHLNDTRNVVLVRFISLILYFNIYCIFD